MATNGATFDDGYYLDLQRRLRGVLAAIGDRLRPDDRQLIEEFIDQNECGLALETISDAIAEDAIVVDPATIDALTGLAETMGLPATLAERLRPLMVG